MTYDQIIPFMLLCTPVAYVFVIGLVFDIQDDLEFKDRYSSFTGTVEK